MADEDPLMMMGGCGTYSQLLFGDDDVVSLGVDSNGCLNFSSTNTTTSNHNSSKMLCFGTKECCDLIYPAAAGGGGGGGMMTSCSQDSSSASSVTTTTHNSNNRRNNVANQGNVKKNKPENPNATSSHAKVRDENKAKREKLGDRIAALQQLVSPFGKGDTASVLHEAMGYIRFLQDQVQVLCSPYLNASPSQSNQDLESRKDMRSRGLCLVPVDVTVNVTHSNGADFWSPLRSNLN